MRPATSPGTIAISREVGHADPRQLDPGEQTASRLDPAIHEPPASLDLVDGDPADPRPVAVSISTIQVVRPFNDIAIIPIIRQAEVNSCSPRPESAILLSIDEPRYRLVLSRSTIRPVLGIDSARPGVGCGMVPGFRHSSPRLCQ